MQVRVIAEIAFGFAQPSCLDVMNLSWVNVLVGDGRDYSSKRSVVVGDVCLLMRKEQRKTAKEDPGQGFG